MTSRKYFSIVKYENFRIHKSGQQRNSPNSLCEQKKKTRNQKTGNPKFGNAVVENRIAKFGAYRVKCLFLCPRMLCLFSSHRTRNKSHQIVGDFFLFN